MPGMGKKWRRLARIEIRDFVKTVQTKSFSKFVSAVCSFKNYAQETYVFVSNLWLRHLNVISLRTLSSIATERE